MSRKSAMSAALAVLVLSGTAMASGFEEAARNVASRLGVTRSPMPGGGFLVKSLVAVTRPAGASAMKVATFESERGRFSPAVFQSAVKESVGGEWFPVVQVWSARTGDEIAMYVKPTGSKWELLIATSESNEGALVYLKIPGRNLLEWLKDKAALREGLGAGIQ